MANEDMNLFYVLSNAASKQVTKKLPEIVKQEQQDTLTCYQDFPQPFINLLGATE